MQHWALGLLQGAVAMPRIEWLRPAVTIAVIALSAGSMLTQAAQAALPGDFLYPVKRMSEDLVGRFTLEPADRARWETIRATRRMDEVHRLSATHRLDEATQVRLEQDIMTNLTGIAAHVEELEESGKEDAALEAGAFLDSALEGEAVRHQSGGSLVDQSERPQDADLEAAVSTSSISDATQSGGTVALQAKEAMEAAERALGDAEDRLASEASRVPETDAERARLNVTQSRRFLIEAGRSYDERAYSDAWAYARRSLSEARRVTTLLAPSDVLILDAGFVGIGASPAAAGSESGTYIGEAWSESSTDESASTGTGAAMFPALP